MPRFFRPVVWLLAAAPAFAASIHVSVTTGDDAADGSATHPLKTINAAAQRAMPGDTVTVHAGVYREWVKPPRGGAGDAHRITYEAAKGERVVITGSEAPKGWVKVKNDTWKLDLPNTFFREGNPFDEQIYGSWYHGHGRPNHTGSVFLDGKRMRETFSLDDVLKPAGAEPHFYAKADGNGGPVPMNFEWIRPVGGGLRTSMHASVENGDQALCISIGDRWPFGYLRDGSILHFDGADFGKGTDELEFQAAAFGAGGTVEMHLGKTPAGPLLGVGTVTNTGDWENFRVFKMKMNRRLSGKRDVCFVVKAPPAKPDGRTVIWAQFPKGADPNAAAVEIAARPTVFFPEKTGVNHITVRGFTLMNAATNWASPSAFQPGLIGPRWAKGWVIENNEIFNSRCSGISLGRPTFGHSHHYQANKYDIYPETGGGQTVAQLRDYFDNGSWDKNAAGHHIVRNNRIHDCGQTGIVGCSGGAFSVIEGNDIHDINRNEPFTGEEMAGIKLHFSVDATLRDNRIHGCNLGLWLDWGAQGARVTGNLFHDNANEVFLEVCHGPVLFDNNLFLSGSATGYPQGVASVHNLFTGGFNGGPDQCAGGRHTFVYKPHDTVSFGKPGNPGGDWRWYNNIFPAGFNPHGQGPRLPVTESGNIFLGAGNAGRWLFNVASFKPEGGPSVVAVENTEKHGTSTEATSGGGTHVAGIRAGDWLRYASVDFGTRSASIGFRVSADAGYGGLIEIHDGKPDGELLGVCEAPVTGGWQNWKTFTAPIRPVSGKKTVCLVFVPAGARDAIAKNDDSALTLKAVAAPKLVEKADGVYLVFDEAAGWRTLRKRRLVTTELLGKAVISKEAFENPDGSPLRIDTDYFGRKRDVSNPFPGPFETPVNGEVKVWPKRP